MHDSGHFFGVHFIWWIIWIVILIWIFATPFKLPTHKTKKDYPLDILKKRFAKGEISKEQYEEAKKKLRSEN